MSHFSFYYFWGFPQQATHDQLTTLLGYDCGKSVPEYVVQMVKNGKTMGHIEKGENNHHTSSSACMTTVNVYSSCRGLRSA